MIAASRRPIELFQPRCRGEWLDQGIFLVCSRDGTDLFHMVPKSYCSAPQELHEHLLEENHALISRPFAGGRFSVEIFDFTLLQTEIDVIPEIFRRVFANPEIDDSHWFHRFREARILIRSREAGLGTVNDVLRF